MRQQNDEVTFWQKMGSNPPDFGLAILFFLKFAEVGLKT
jgi:hypothetical protein